MKIALVYGFWGQNIGNAFFNLGAEQVLRAAGHTVYPVQDHPAYWTFRDEAKGSYRSRFRFIENIEVDLVLLQGPLFTRNFDSIWMDTLTSLADRSVSWAALSAGFRSYTAVEVSALEAVMERAPARFISTRDATTFDMLSRADLGRQTELRSGICAAFFAPQAFEAPRMRRPVVSFCFDHFLEPDLDFDVFGPTRIGGSNYRPSVPSRLNRFAGRTKGHAYVAQLVDRRIVPSEIEGMEIVRPEHRTNPHLPFKIYQRPNGLASDEPYTYLTTYANSSVTLSDRVHACVATLAYGGTAQLFNPTTKRAALFDAVGAGDIVERTVQVDRTRLDSEYEAALDFLGKFA